MTKPLLITLALFCCLAGHAQQNVLLFKKGNKVIDRYWIGKSISFLLKYQGWQQGEITKIQNDSFYIRPTIVQYNMMGTDTFHFPVLGVALADIYAMPKKGYLLHYANGRWEISKTGGHVHWYWVKSGWIFRVGAAGYAALYIINGLIDHDLSLNNGSLAIAAGVFLFGVLLKHLYKPTLRLRNKFHLEIVNLS